MFVKSLAFRTLFRKKLNKSNSYFSALDMYIFVHAPRELSSLTAPWAPAGVFVHGTLMGGLRVVCNCGQCDLFGQWWWT